MTGFGERQLVIEKKRERASRWKVRSGRGRCVTL